MLMMICLRVLTARYRIAARALICPTLSMSTVATAVTDLASLCAASGLGTADLVDTNEADLNDVFEEFGVSVSTKVKIKKELLASKKQNKKNKKKGDGMSAGLLAADHQQQTALPQRFQQPPSQECFSYNVQ